MLASDVLHYPVFLDLRGRAVLVVGAGAVALRKTKGLVEAGARVTVVAPEHDPGFASLPVTVLHRPFAPADVEGAFLVFAATSDRSVNRLAAEAAKARGIPVNVADAPGECDFICPARARRGHIQVAVSTGGRNPRQAVAVRRALAETLARLPISEAE